MKDLITLSCPTCGGRLQLGTNSTRYTCEYCGRDHIVSQEDAHSLLEHSSHCPVCNRNDRVEKVSAVSKNSNLYPELAKILACPLEPSFDEHKVLVKAEELLPDAPEYLQVIETDAVWNSLSFGYINLTASMVILFARLYLSAGGAQGTFILDILTFLTFASGVYLLIHGKKKASENSARNQQLETMNFVLQENWEEEKLAIQEKYLSEQSMNYQQQLKTWQTRLARWKKLYYCQRDDCIFVPDEDTHASPAKMDAYLGL